MAETCATCQLVHAPAARPRVTREHVMELIVLITRVWSAGQSYTVVAQEAIASLRRLGIEVEGE